MQFKFNRYAVASGFALSLAALSSAPANAWTSLSPGSDMELGINVLTDDDKACSYGDSSGINPDSIVGVASIKSELVNNHEGGDTTSCLSFDKTTTDTHHGATSLETKDAGTNDFAGGTWYRPMARNSDGSYEENGKLEVGSFTFDLDDEYSSAGGQLKFRFLDTEGSWGNTGVTVAGVFHRALDSKGGNNNIAEIILDMTDSFTISVGKDTGGTGDGVNFQVFAKLDEPAASVPEPSMALGLVAVAGLVKSRRRR